MELNTLRQKYFKTGALLPLFAVIIYALVFSSVYSVIGLPVTLFEFLIIAISGWFYGIGVGLFAGLLFALTGTFLINQFGETLTWQVNVGVLGFEVGIGILTGWMGSRQRKFKNQRNNAMDALRLKDFALSSSISAVAISNLDGGLTYVNHSFLKMWGYKTKKEVLENPEIELWKYTGQMGVITKALQKHGSWIETSVGKKKDGTFFDIQVAAHLVKNEEGVPISMMASFLDITKRRQSEKELKNHHNHLEELVDEKTAQLQEKIVEQKQIEKKLLDNKNKYQLLEKSMKDVVVWISSDGKLLYVSPNIKEFGGYDPQTEIGRDMTKYFELEDDMIRAAELLTDAFKTQESGSFEFLFKPAADKAPFPVEHTYLPVFQDNEMIAVQLVVRDISERKEAEKKLVDSLREKEILLREVHHRVKNNMAVIISLLEMHSNRKDKTNIKQIFMDCRDRIYAMSLIHESLYQSDDLSRINFETYLSRLCINLSQVYDASNKGITVTVSKCDVTLGMDQGIAVGMMISELISNAFKHAFPNDQGGTVSVSLLRLDKNKVELIVQDDGQGIPQEIDITRSRSLGLRLTVAMVTRELGGSIKVERDNGTRLIIHFNCVN